MNDAFAESSHGSQAVRGSTRNAMSIGWRASKKLVLPVITLLLCMTGNSISATNADLTKAIDDLNVALSSASAELDKLAQTQTQLINLYKLTNADRVPLLVGGVVAGTPGSNVVVPISYSRGPAIAGGVQVDIVIPSSFTVVGVAKGQAAIDSGKDVQFSVIGSVLRIIVFGFNLNVINSGVVANVTFAPSLEATKKPHVLRLRNAAATTPEANEFLILETAGAVVLQ